MGCGRGLEESAVLFVSSFRHLTSSLSSHISRDISECRKLRGCNPETMNPIVTWENKREKGTLRSEYLSIKEEGGSVLFKSWILHHHRPLDMFLHSMASCCIQTRQVVSPILSLHKRRSSTLVWHCITNMELHRLCFRIQRWIPSSAFLHVPVRQLSRAKLHEKWIDLGLG